jgi:hypothetical protein
MPSPAEHHRCQSPKISLQKPRLLGGCRRNAIKKPARRIAVRDGNWVAASAALGTSVADTREAHSVRVDIEGAIGVPESACRHDV